MSSWSSKTRLYASHLPLCLPARALLSVGTALGALLYPQRADLVAAVGELTGGGALRALQVRMEGNAVGRRILREKPLVTVKLCPKSLVNLSLDLSKYLCDIDAINEFGQRS
jgi:hypothetical protein